MNCPICEKEILSDDRKYLLGNDRPYFNVYLHRSCYDEHRLNILEFVSKMLEIYRKSPKKR